MKKIYKAGQINIEFTGGAVLFLITLTFVISSVLAILPKYTQINEENKFENLGWSLSDILINEKGYWSSANDNGTDWQNHINSIKVLGLAKNYHTLDEEKINALSSLSYEKAKAVLGINENFQIQLKEYVVVDMFRTFKRGFYLGTSITGEPTDPFYQNSDPSIHYGLKKLNGKNFYFLIASQNKKDYRLYISNTADFSSFKKYDVSKNYNLTLGGLNFTLEENNGIISSEGNIVILNKEVLVFGRDLSKIAKRIFGFKRYAELNGNIIELNLYLW